MGCSDSFCLSDKQNQVLLVPNQNYQNQNNLIDTFNFNIGDYPVFEDNFYSKNVQNIKKVYSELLFDNDRPINKLHKIFITRDFNKDKTTITQIEVLNGYLYQQRLTVQTINGCNIEILRPFIENFNDIFNINSADWYYQNDTTDIYIKSEIEYQNRLNTFIMFYKKDIKNLNFVSTDFIGNHYSKGERTDVKPNEVVNIYNKFKSGFEIDNKPEIFYYYEEIPVKRNYNSGIKYSNNNNNRNNNNDNYSSYSRQESNRSNGSDKKSKSSASMRDRIGNRLGRVESNGDIKDEIGNRIGRFESDGDIKDRIGNSIGRIESDGDIKDRIGNLIGRIESDGEVKDRIGNRLGIIESDGEVKDRIGNRIGNAQGMDKGQAAYLYFFKDE
jgi:uncharacterized protein YjbJ (UPF0337 family)